MKYRNRHNRNVFSMREKDFFKLLILFLFSISSFSQVTSSVDTTNIKIGEQITFKIQVETDSANIVVFPQAKEFSPLEVI